MKKYQINQYNIIEDFHQGYGKPTFSASIDFSLWESLEKWLNNLTQKQKEIVIPFYLKIKKHTSNDLVFEKSLQIYFLFRLRIETEIHSLEQLKYIANKIYLDAKALFNNRSPDFLANYLKKNCSYLRADDMHKLQSWHPKYFTNFSIFPPGNIRVKNYKFIVHMIGESYFYRLNFGTLEEEMRTWDAISTSIVSDKCNYFYKRFGVVLTVPVSNILLTFSEDAMFQNHIGNKKMDDFQLIGQNYSENEIKNKGLLSKHIQRSYRYLSTPDEILEKAYRLRTEIVVCGRPGVNIHPNFPASGNIKIAAVVYVSDPKNQPTLENEKKILEAAQIIQNRYKVPFIRLDGNVDGLI